jgi:small subunit ribosomal protein S3
MTHVVHPYAHRLTIIKDWRSRWFGTNGKFREFLRGDTFIREYLEKRLRGMHIGYIEIERNNKILRIIIGTARAGAIIGRSGEGIEKLRNDLVKELNRKGIKTEAEIKIDIEEVRTPEANALIVAQMVAEGLEKRMPFRRVIKQTIEKVLAAREVEGVKIRLGGRLGGADMARTESLRKGRIPLQTFRSDIDFARYKAKIPQGDIGIKVWIYRGDIFEKKKAE